MKNNLLPRFFGVAFLTCLFLLPVLGVSASTQTITINKAYFDKGKVDGSDTYVLTPIFVTAGLTTNAFSVAIDADDIDKAFSLSCLDSTVYSNAKAYWIASYNTTNIILTDSVTIYALSNSGSTDKVTIALYSGSTTADSKLTYDIDSDGQPATVDSSVDPLPTDPKALLVKVATADIATMTGSSTLTLTYYQNTSDSVGLLVYIAVPVVIVIAVYKKLLRMF